MAQDILATCTIDTPDQPTIELAFGFDAAASRSVDALDLPLPPPSP
ncbi:MAG: hypothetical protein GY838_09345 [bacterium]|nr:hypothetical protein [bacterium]